MSLWEETTVPSSGILSPSRENPQSNVVRVLLSDPVLGWETRLLEGVWVLPFRCLRENVERDHLPVQLPVRGPVSVSRR